jgi:hypothetical protein
MASTRTNFGGGLFTWRRVRRVRRLLADAPFRQPHPLQDCLGEEQRKAPIELRPEMPAQHFLGSPGDRPFGRVGLGHGVRIGHAPIKEQDGNIGNGSPVVSADSQYG